ncbi:putative MFS family arabinose efflux permease [Actinoplanes lutulentus]|uniref:Putative MFS family arabinose efflux permease n=1 Tax=Actinoplanes lutulentus TaxID=1287878 RepID=A0A327ZEN0_9ACTN|nr:MFS transporter [Actinoplanes lutulentus]MBB2941636.1 putative MFS family arabinose efflux permease [Actinoplanes lutulentus]RAK39556.1 putative MFS family arabinose efflux permease [Actinoplanes lutulentus]
MQTYRELFRNREFAALFTTACAQNAAGTVTGLALATEVYSRTRSPLFAALSMFGPSLAQLAGATLLLSAADRLPPRAAISSLALVTATLVGLLSTGPPIWLIFVLLLGMGLAGSLAGGVRGGLLTEIVPPDAYVLGRSALNIATGTMQIVGFSAGGLLVTVLSPGQTLLVGAGLHLTASAVARLGLSRRAPRASGRPSVVETWRVNRRLWTITSVRPVYLGLWIPNGLIVGCEALFVPYSPTGAGVLLASAAVGMLTGDVLAGRFLPPSWRDRLAPFLRLLLAVPYLALAFDPHLAIAAVAVVIASIGYCSTLLLQERLVALVPADARGQALGLHTSGMLTMQAVCAALAGTVAEFTTPAVAIGVMSAASITVTLLLAPALGRGSREHATMTPA